MIDFLKNKYRGLSRKLKFIYSVNWLKTFYFNYKMFPYKTAKKLPVFFYGKVKFSSLKGSIDIDAPIKTAMIGFGQPYELISRTKSKGQLVLNGRILFKGHVQIGINYFVLIGNQAYCEFGHLASLASNGKIICKEKIILGDYARIGSESQLIDTNFHQMINTITLDKYPLTGTIEIGDYNFVSNRVTIMHKTKTPNYCTIASNSLCNKDYSGFGENILIGGIPAKLLKENISRDWEGERNHLDDVLIVK